MKLTLPQDMKLVVALAPKTTNGAKVGDYISLKNCSGRVWVLCCFTQAVAHATAITLEQATNVAGAGSTPITVPVPIWSNVDAAAGDTMTKRTSAVSYTLPADAKEMLVCFQVDAGTLDEGYDCLTVKTAASSQATNFVSAVYVIDNKYGGASAPSFVVD